MLQALHGRLVYDFSESWKLDSKRTVEDFILGDSSIRILTLGFTTVFWLFADVSGGMLVGIEALFAVRTISVKIGHRPTRLIVIASIEPTASTWILVPVDA